MVSKGATHSRCNPPTHLPILRALPSPSSRCARACCGSPAVCDSPAEFVASSRPGEQALSERGRVLHSSVFLPEASSPVHLQTLRLSAQAVASTAAALEIRRIAPSGDRTLEQDSGQRRRNGHPQALVQMVTDLPRNGRPSVNSIDGTASEGGRQQDERTSRNRQRLRDGRARGGRVRLQREQHHATENGMHY